MLKTGKPKAVPVKVVLMCGEPAAVWVILKFAVLLPAEEVGAKVTVKVRTPPPPAIVQGNPSTETLKSPALAPALAISLTVSGLPPLFVIVKVWAEDD